MQTLGRWNGPRITMTQLSLQQQVDEKVNFAWREAGVFYIFSKKSQATLHWQGLDAYSKNFSGKSMKIGISPMLYLGIIFQPHSE